MDLLDFFSREAGQRRRQSLEDGITYFVPPELRGLLGLAADMNPVSGTERAGQGAERVFNTSGMDRVQAIGDTLSEMAGVAAPVAAARAVGMPAVRAVQEGLLGLSATPEAAAVRDFAADEFGGVGLPGFRAFHGSPHDFDRFDMSKIGTGEGAQAYGHGLYFAENEGVARGYRDQLSRDVFYDGNPVSSVHPMDNPQAGAIHSVAKAVADGIPAEQAMAFEAGQWRAWADPYLRAAQENPQLAAEAARRAQSMTDIASAIEALDPQKFVKNPGRMYEVQINANPEDFLDWDKPLSEQPPNVRSVVEQLIEPPLIYERPEEVWGTGRYLATLTHPTQATLNAAANTADEASEKLMRNITGRYLISPHSSELQSGILREAGVPGIRYLDAGSRGAGDGSRNYVVFDDKLIDIVRKYGIAGAATLYGVSAMDIEAAMAGERQPQGLLGDN